LAVDLPHLVDDDEVAELLGYRDVRAFRRHRKALEAKGFPKPRPVVKRYSPAEIRGWIDGTATEPRQLDADPLLEVAGRWGKSK
jgi:hypothetical protein